MNEVIKTIAQETLELKVEGGVVVQDRGFYDKHMPKDVTPDLPNGITPAVADLVHTYDANFAVGTAKGIGEAGFASGDNELHATFATGNGTVEHLYQRTVEIGGEERSNYLTTTVLTDFGGEDDAMAQVLKQIAELATEA